MWNFAAAIVFKTDILVFSSDMGNKWMIFTGKGAKLINALTSPSVNNARSLYINHDGVHYEPILGMQKIGIFCR